MTQNSVANSNSNSEAGPTALADLSAMQLFWLAAALFIVAAGYGTLLPLLPGWLAQILPGSSSASVGRHVGFVNGIYAVGIFVGAPLWGLVSDHLGRRKILLIGLVGYVGSLLALLVADFVELWAIYLLRGLTGFFVAAVVPIVSALIAEHTPEKKRAQRFAWLGAMSLLGTLIGPGVIDSIIWLGSLIGQDVTAPRPMATVVIVLSALSGIVIMLALARMLPAQPQDTSGFLQHQAPPKTGRTAVLWWLSAAVMSVLAGFEVIMMLQGQETSSMASRQVSIMLAVCSFVMLVVNATLFFTDLLEKVPSHVLMGIGSVLTMAGLIVLALSKTGFAMYVGLSLAAAGTGLVIPVISYLAAGVSKAKLGVTMGSLAAAIALGQAVGSSAGGWLFGEMAQRSFLILISPVAAMLIFLIARPGLWSEKK